MSLLLLKSASTAAAVRLHLRICGLLPAEKAKVAQATASGARLLRAGRCGPVFEQGRRAGRRQGLEERGYEATIGTGRGRGEGGFSWRLQLASALLPARENLEDRSR